MDLEKKGRFLKVYQNLPLNERKNIILIIENGREKPEKKPISWDITYLEIDQETEIGEMILNKLINLNLI